MSEATLRVCLIQFASKDTLDQTLSHLEEIVEKAVSLHHPQIIALPECFTFAYETDLAVMKVNAESISDGKTYKLLSNLSKKYGVYIVGGSVELDGSNMYNTSTVWNPNGEMVARHRKVHLCDVNLDGLEIIEVDKLTPGEDMTTFDVNEFKCGIAICYDATFSEFIKLYGRAGCHLLFCPSAYEEKTVGPSFWELTNRARALDNQFFVAAISPARNKKHNYVCYGHSIIIDPTGRILAEAGAEEEIVFHEIDLKTLYKFRDDLPLIRQSRTDVYNKYNKQ